MWKLRNREVKQFAQGYKCWAQNTNPSLSGYKVLGLNFHTTVPLIDDTNLKKIIINLKMIQ